VPNHINGVWLVQEQPGMYLALDLTCTHQCCPVAWSSTEFRCPCHGAVFGATGTHVSGPGSKPLAPLTVVCTDATGVTLQP